MTVRPSCPHCDESNTEVVSNGKGAEPSGDETRSFGSRRWFCGSCRHVWQSGWPFRLVEDGEDCVPSDDLIAAGVIDLYDTLDELGLLAWA